MPKHNSTGLSNQSNDTGYESNLSPEKLDTSPEVVIFFEYKTLFDLKFYTKGNLLINDTIDLESVSLKILNFVFK
jgi:hypothetical protein